MYRSFKDDNSSFKNVKTNAKCDPAKITENFQKHFNLLHTDEPPLELQQAPRFIVDLKKINIERIGMSSSSKKEKYDIMKKVKGGKS